MIHNAKNFQKLSDRKFMLSRLAVLMAKAQAFTAVHNLTGLEITLTHITPANQAHFLGHKLSLKLARDFNHPDDSRAWLKVSPISRYIPADKLDKIQAHMKDCDMDPPFTSEYPPIIWPLHPQWPR